MRRVTYIWQVRHTAASTSVSEFMAVQCYVMLCCDVGTLTSGVMLCYVCYVVTCHTAQRDTPRDRVSIVTLRQCHHMPQSGLHYAELSIKYSGGIENNNCKIHNPDPLWSSGRYLPGHLQQQHAALQWSSSCYHDINIYCIDINYISKSGLMFVELQEYDPPVRHQLSITVIPSSETEEMALILD